MSSPNPMTLEQIKNTVKSGQTVFWTNRAYTVICDRTGFYWVEYLDGHKSPLVNSKGEMNEKESDFFIL